MGLLTAKQNSKPLTWGKGHPNVAATELSHIVQISGRNKVIFLWELGLEVYKKPLKNTLTKTSDRADLCPRSALLPLNTKAQRLFKGRALRSTQTAYGVSRWLTGAMLTPEKSTNLFTGQATVQALALPSLMLQFAASLTVEVWWPMQLLILSSLQSPNEKCSSPFPHHLHQKTQFSFHTDNFRI